MKKLNRQDLINHIAERIYDDAIEKYDGGTHVAGCFRCFGRDIEYWLDRNTDLESVIVFKPNSGESYDRISEEVKNKLDVEDVIREYDDKLFCGMRNRSEDERSERYMYHFEMR